MHYVQLADDVIILSTSNGSHTLNRYTFNFNKIVALLKSESTEDLILPLLEKPDTPNGVYFVYLDPILNTIVVSHRQGHSEHVSVLGKSAAPSVFNPEEATFLGVYASMENIYEDWPEYAL